jgi:hypothetical protein
MILSKNTEMILSKNTEMILSKNTEMIISLCLAERWEGASWNSFQMYYWFEKNDIYFFIISFL